MCLHRKTVLFMLSLLSAVRAEVAAQRDSGLLSASELKALGRHNHTLIEVCAAEVLDAAVLAGDRAVVNSWLG